MKLLIGGDVSVADSAELFAKGEAKSLFSDVADEFQKADEVIVNLECAVTDKEREIKKFGPCLKAPFGTIVSVAMRILKMDIFYTVKAIFILLRQGLLKMKRRAQNGITAFW